ncbi:YjcZ family sporulation protein [Evansella halocellulosilytica]|uniref:YjcZ family sporulation protein n=1 Tax=Evansella halocellulosilytica TaxID=2011013 RepID=UPI000BB7F97E|nr:YjcZ family sporulation protein [Evansella halocellulosilytica]
MYSNVNAPPTLGANIHPNIPPMPTQVAPAYGYDDHAFGYGYPAPARHTNYFTLIVVLFVLLIIVGVSCFPYKVKDC